VFEITLRPPMSTMTIPHGGLKFVFKRGVAASTEDAGLVEACRNSIDRSGKCHFDIHDAKDKDLERILGVQLEFVAWQQDSLSP
jgi:hypothetical protein